MLTRNRPLSSRHAFTLIELIVVVVILGLLAALAVPAFNAVVERSRDEAVEASWEAVVREAQALAAFDQTAVTAAHIARALGDLGSAAVTVTDEPGAPYLYDDGDGVVGAGEWIADGDPPSVVVAANTELAARGKVVVVAITAPGTSPVAQVRDADADGDGLTDATDTDAHLADPPVTDDDSTASGSESSGGDASGGDTSGGDTSQVADYGSFETAEPGAVAAADDFDRPEGTTLTTTSSGHGWQALAGTLTTNANGRAQASTAPARSVVDVGSPHVRVRATLPSEGNGHGLLLRYQDADNHLKINMTGGYSTLQVVEVVAGTATVLAEVNLFNAAGHLDVYADGTQVVVYREGTKRLEATVAEPASSATGAGIYTSDTFRVFDDFSAEALAVDTPAVPADLAVTDPDAPVVLQWDRHAATDLLGYRVFRDGSLVATVDQPTSGTTASYSDAGVTAGSSHSWSVTAVDRYGNASASTSVGPITVGDGQPLAVTDDFERLDADTLGTTADGRPWRMLQGEAGIVSGHAEGTDAATGRPWAVIDANATDVDLTVDLTRQSQGVLLRYQDPDNYISIVYGYRATITEVVDGTSTVLANTYFNTNPGTITVALEGTALSWSSTSGKSYSVTVATPGAAATHHGFITNVGYALDNVAIQPR